MNPTTQIVSSNGHDPARKPKTIEDLFGAGETGNLLQGRFSTAAIYAWFQKRHQQFNHLVDEEGVYTAYSIVHKGGKRYRRTHRWRVPYGVRYALKHPLIHGQIVHRYPWYVTWRSPKTGKRLKKYHGSLIQAIHFVATKAQYVDPSAAVGSRLGYDLPPKLRGKIPVPWKWCPCCMTARKYHRVASGETFFGTVKTWNEEKQYYQFPERKLALMRCEVCGLSNRDTKYRRANQPWEVRKFKKGVRRARRKV